MEETADQRAKDGIFLSFQNPLEVPGVSLRNFIRNAVEQRSGSRIKLWTFKKELEKAMEVLQMDPSYGDRDLNVGFSGGEKKKAEILQLLMLKPSLAILDETDSGLDVDAVRTVSKGVEEYQKDKKGALLIITHSTRILEYLHVDKTHVLVNGKIDVYKRQQQDSGRRSDKKSIPETGEKIPSGYQCRRPCGRGEAEGSQRSLRCAGG